VRSFYGAVFGWRYAETPGRSDVVGLDGPRVSIRGRDRREANGWLPYFLVENTLAAAARAEELGGRNLGRAESSDSALLPDPTGARFAVLGEGA
jgi:predicted enzyme related to lactoylglutathione lyase